MQTDPIGYGDGLNWYVYVKNDPLNKTDPSGLVKREIERKYTVTGSRIKRNASITVESGDLSQEQTEQLLSGVDTDFFRANAGADISQNGKSVEGNSKENIDKANVASQLIGTKLGGRRGNDQIKKAWGNVKKIVATDINSPALASIGTDARYPSYGVMQLNSGAFGGSWSRWTNGGLFSTILHETLHLHKRYANMRFYNDSLYQEYHKELNVFSEFIASKVWKFE